MDTSPDSPQPDRREFLTKTAAILVGGVVVVAPAVAGLGVLLDPLKRFPLKQKGETGLPVRVASLNSLPEGGAPVKFSVLTTQVDAWNRTENVPIGAVYLQRTGPQQIRALNAKCPHTGCFVNYQPGDKNHFHCPCHDSTFAANGKILDLQSPSPRDLDELPVEIRNGTEVWVSFQNFRTGVHEKFPV